MPQSGTRRSSHRSTLSLGRWLGSALRWLFGLGLILFVVLVALRVREYTSREPTNRTLVLGVQDIDPETTMAARSLIKQNLLNPVLALYLLSDVRRSLFGSALAAGELSLKNGKVDASVEPLARGLEKSLDTGQAAAFTFWISPQENSSTERIALQIDNVELGEMTIGPERSAITLIQRKNRQAKLKITALGPQPLVVRAQTAASEAETRELRPGEQSSWDLVFLDER
jgi:hypothetical protein